MRRAEVVEPRGGEEFIAESKRAWGFGRVQEQVVANDLVGGGSDLSRQLFQQADLPDARDGLEVQLWV